MKKHRPGVVIEGIPLLKKLREIKPPGPGERVALALTGEDYLELLKILGRVSEQQVFTAAIMIDKEMIERLKMGQEQIEESVHSSLIDQILNAVAEHGVYKEHYNLKTGAVRYSLDFSIFKG